jgi:Uma2 family endonuclease
MLLQSHVENGQLCEVLCAPIDCILSETTVVQPDLVFVARDHADLGERGIEGPPTLAVKVVSPSTESIDRRRKLKLYAKHAIQHYWIVDPVMRTIEAYGLVSESYRVTGRLAGSSPTALIPFPDLPLDPSALWM